MIKITESNCNYHLKMLYKERDQIGIAIDKAIEADRPDSVEKLEKEYDSVINIIDEFLAFRRTHDCLLEGDPGYGAV